MPDSTDPVTRPGTSDAATQHPGTHEREAPPPRQNQGEPAQSGEANRTVPYPINHTDKGDPSVRISDGQP